MASFKKAKGRPVRYAVKLITKVVPPKVLQEWKSIASYIGWNDHIAIPHNVWTKINQFLSLRFCFISPEDMVKVHRKIDRILH